MCIFQFLQVAQQEVCTSNLILTRSVGIVTMYCTDFSDLVSKINSSLVGNIPCEVKKSFNFVAMIDTITEPKQFFTII